MSDKNNIRVGINGLPLSKQVASGVPRHIWEVCKQFDEIWPEAEFFLYLQNGDGIVPPSTRWTIREEKSAFWKKVKPNLWLKFRCSAAIAKDCLDVFWSATGILPKIPPSVPSCNTVFDLNIEIVPETMPFFTRLAYGLFFKRDVKNSTKVLAASRGTYDKLVQFYGVRSAAIVPSGASSEFRVRTAEEIGQIREKYGLGKQFCLAVGTIEPRKNILNLLLAFELLEQRGALNGHTLALIGKSGWKNADVLKLIAKNEKTWLRRLGFVSDEDLAKLYGATHLYIFPSLYEGFGIPVIEARACGARVAVTDIPELREYCGSNAVLIPGTDPQTIAAALAANLKKRYIQSEPDFNLPSWRLAAEITQNVLLSAIAENREN